MLNRRRFLKDSALVSLAPMLPTFLSRTAAAARSTNKDDGRILVVIQLDGGNDGINTVVPFKDEGYVKNRDELRLPEKDLIKLTDEFAFHPRLRSASKLFEEDRLSVVHGIGYPNPNRSHFESMAIWHRGSTGEETRHTDNGWIGDAISIRATDEAPHAIHVGDESLPVALRGRRCTAISISSPADLRLKLKGLSIHDTVNRDALSLTDFVTRSTAEAFTSAKELASSTKEDASASYPNSKLAKRLKLVGQMIKSNAKARVYYTLQEGYDTHAVQLSAHGNLLGTLRFAESIHGRHERVWVGRTGDGHGVQRVRPTSQGKWLEWNRSRYCRPRIPRRN